MMIDSPSLTAKERTRTPRGTALTRGVSLIEVLVVLVLLVTGILVIIRLYPSGFFSIQSTGNAALGDALGTAAVGTQTQDAGSLPEAILTGALDTLGQPLSTALSASYDPDDPNTLDNARVISNETITVPSVSGGKSVYAVKYGPIPLGIDPAVGTDPTATVLTMLPTYLSIHGLNWTALDGNPSGDSTSPIFPQDTLTNAPPRSFLVDLTNKKIAVPFAPYTLTNATTTPPTYTSYDQRMVVTIYGSDGLTYLQYLDVPAGTLRDSTNKFAPKDANNPQGYLPDTSTNYHGGWFDPTTTYPDPNVAPPQKTVPNGVAWLRVILYRPFTGIANTKPFGLDPYQFQVTSPNIGTANINPGAIAFSPLAGGANGLPPLKAQITYLTESWKILREDHDIPALSGSSTTVVRTTVQNLRQAGAADPNDVIYPGIAGSGKSLFILDLDTGQAVGASAVTDPTNTDAPVVDEDTNGTSANADVINVSYATGRFTFGSNAFKDNANGTTPRAHRVRIFYESDIDWTVAVQKAPSAYTRIADVAANTDPQIGAGQCAFDLAGKKVLYFPRSDYGKTVEIDNLTTYDASGGAIPATPSALIVVIGKGTGDTLDTLGTTPYWSVSAVAGPLATATLYPKGPGGSSVTFTVRGLSSRAVVAWKERNQWKVHSVDTVLNRTP